MLGEKRIGRERVMVTVGIVAAVVGLTLMGLVISTDTGLLSSDWVVLWNMGAISGAAAEVSVDCCSRSGPWVHSLSRPKVPERFAGAVLSVSPWFRRRRVGVRRRRVVGRRRRWCPHPAWSR